MDTEWFLFGRDRKSDDWALVDNGGSFDEMVKARAVFEGKAKILRFKYYEIKHISALLED